MILALLFNARFLKLRKAQMITYDCHCKAHPLPVYGRGEPAVSYKWTG